MTAALEMARPQEAPEAWREDFPKLVDEVLHAAVSSKGPDAKPRPGQLHLVEDIVQTMHLRQRMAGVAGTGTGKSYALMVPAMADAVMTGERTLISTHSIALQSQFIKQDSPVVQDAVKQVTGMRPSVAVLKGWSNYSCAVAVRQLAQTVFGFAPKEEELVGLVEHTPRSGTIRIKDTEYELANVLDLLQWCLVEDIRDKADYTGELPGALWSLVSIGTDDCVGDDCPLAAICSPRRARDRAAEADVVITNHTLLGIQAVTGAPIILGNKTLGPFSTVMIDEAHELPGVARDRGTISFTGSQVTRIGFAVSRFVSAAEAHLEAAITAAIGEYEEAPDYLLEERDRVNELGMYAHYFGDLGDSVEAALSQLYTAWPDNEVVLSRKEIDLYGKDTVLDRPAGDRCSLYGHTVQESMDNLVSRCLLTLPDYEDAYSYPDDATTKLLRNRARNALINLRNWQGRLSSPDDEYAKWVNVTTEKREGRDVLVPVAECAPIDVATMLNDNLWSRKAGYPTVVAVSATMPEGFVRTAGLGCPEPALYASPYDASYGNSALYFPRMDHLDLDQVATPDEDNGQFKFDHAKHRTWATEQICRLVEANEGSALILSTSREAGIHYAEALRELRDREYYPWDVLSQWDGRSTEEIVKDWKSDVPAVLVGTKSLMTGVDAPGRTCTLVVLDRIPRSGQSAIDEARARHLARTDGILLRDARDQIYVYDAASKLEQAAGRLIRSTDDKGLLALLDPRLAAKDIRLKYKDFARDKYRRAVGKFPKESKIDTEEDAIAFLKRQAGEALLARNT